MLYLWVIQNEKNMKTVKSTKEQVKKMLATKTIHIFTSKTGTHIVGTIKKIHGDTVICTNGNRFGTTYVNHENGKFFLK